MILASARPDSGDTSLQVQLVSAGLDAVLDRKFLLVRTTRPASSGRGDVEGAIEEGLCPITGALQSADGQPEPTRLTGRLAEITGASAVYLAAPSLVSTPAVRRAIVRDASIVEVSQLSRA